MLIIGIVFLLAFAFFAWKEYVSYLNKGGTELHEFILFLGNMKEKMTCYLEAPSEWVGDFSAPGLEATGFLQKIRDGMGLGEAYSSCSDFLCIDKEARSVLDDLFARLGGGYLDTELGMINSSIDKLSKIEETTKKERENKVRATGAMIGAVAAGAVILIL